MHRHFSSAKRQMVDSVPFLSQMDYLVRHTHVDPSLISSSTLPLLRSASHGLSLGPFPFLQYLFPLTRALYHYMYHHLITFPSIRFHDLLLLGPVS